MKLLFINKYKTLTIYNLCWIIGFFWSLNYIFEKHRFWYFYTFLNFTQLFFILFMCLIAFLIEKKIYKIKNIEIKNPKANEIFTRICFITSFIVFLIYLAIGYDLHRISTTID